MERPNEESEERHYDRNVISLFADTTALRKKKMEERSQKKIPIR
jgi:hypothetical protein